MRKRLIFTFLWMVAGFVGAAIVSLLLAPLVARYRNAGGDHAALIAITIGFALMPLVGVGAPLILGLMGKLPGTKKDGVG